jgi:hypothetical protein
LGVHHLVNRDDRHLLAHAMVSDFSVAHMYLLNAVNIVYDRRLVTCPQQLVPSFLDIFLHASQLFSPATD